MGMVTSFSWVRGTSANLWAPNGLPLGIDVSMTVTDMYPTMAIASNLALLRQNIGLSAFLDNLCGLNMMRANIGSHLKASLTTKLASIFGVDDAAITAGSDVVENAASMFKELIAN